MTKMEYIQAALQAGARGIEVIALASKIEEYCEGKITADLGKDGCVEIRDGPSPSGESANRDSGVESCDGKVIVEVRVPQGSPQLSRYAPNYLYRAYSKKVPVKLRVDEVRGEIVYARGE